MHLETVIPPPRKKIDAVDNLDPKYPHCLFSSNPQTLSCTTPPLSLYSEVISPVPKQNSNAENIKE